MISAFGAGGVNAYANMAPGTCGYQVLLHELGHAMGLSHPHDGQNLILNDAYTTQTTTVMTYNLESPAATDLGPVDVEALQVLYGTTTGAAAGWTVSTLGNVPVITATEADETIIATGQGTRIIAGGGDDIVWGREGNDSILGGFGIYTLRG